MRTRIIQVALAVPLVLLLGGLTACGGSSPKASAAAAASASLVTPCTELQTWNSSNTATAKTISGQLAGTQAGTDFAKLMSAMNDGDYTSVRVLVSALSADCAKAGVVVHLTLTFTDPNGVTCQALDASGYCPGDNPSTGASSSGGASNPSASPSTPSPSPSPVPTMIKQTDVVVFRVQGTGYPSILYGTDSIQDQASGGYGPLGDGNALPWTASLPYNPGALYYAVSAQLEGSGSISDSVTEVITTWCSNGTHKTESFPLASGSASGGYTIAQAEYAGGDTGNAAQAESDAGC